MAVGVNFTDTVQFAAAASVVPHVVVCEKSAAFAPAILNARFVSGITPEFVIVRTVAALLVPTLWEAKL